MIIKDKRELAYIVLIDNILPIEGADRVEVAVVGGWRIMVQKGQFKVGDKAIYFEIDSRVPQTPEFEFLSKKDWKIKTQKYFKGTVISQGLLMSLSDFGWNPEDFEVHQPLTEKLGVTYIEEEDNKRKASNKDLAYQSMMSRRKNLFKKPWAKWMMKRSWGRKVMFFLFGKKKDNPRSFPSGFPHVHKTDEERIENLPHLLGYENPLIVTEKLDGTSCTYILEKKWNGSYEFYVSSRNVRQLKPDQETFFNQSGEAGGNIYWDLAKKYNIEHHLKEYMKGTDLKYVCIQGEGVGRVQGNPLKLKEDDLYVFNFIRSDVGRISSTNGKSIVESMGMKWVPIIDTNYYMPNDMEEFKLFADGPSVVNPNVLREGYVLRDPKTGLSFKNVSRKFLLNKK